MARALSRTCAPGTAVGVLRTECETHHSERAGAEVRPRVSSDQRWDGAEASGGRVRGKPTSVWELNLLQGERLKRN